LWSAVLLGFVIICSGLVMAQVVESAIKDEAQDMDLRVWAYERYGTGTRAAYTMFEATLSGGWPNYARRLIEEVNPLYGLFWVPYVTFVVFAIIRVITALFLKNTLKVSEGDDETKIQERAKSHKKFAAKLRAFLERADKNGDGVMDRHELHAAVNNTDITKHFEAIELDLNEIAGLFDVLDDGDGLISAQEFLEGCERLKGQARAVDSIVIMHEQRNIRKDIDKLKVEILEVLLDVRHLALEE